MLVFVAEHAGLNIQKSDKIVRFTLIFVTF